MLNGKLIQMHILKVKFPTNRHTYICFTNNPKLGVTRATESKIPAGIFGYPLNYNVQEDIEDGEIQEASEKNMLIFST